MIREACCIVALLAVHPALATDIPAKLAPPPDAKLVGAYQATGDQIYVCTAQGQAIEPVFKAPEAQLLEKDKPVAKHYAGPTWEATDGSKVVGKVAESVPAPKQGDIPWLLLTAQSTGQGLFAGVRFVQRVETQGGAAAQMTCPTAGMELRVPYSATYRFFR
ncbi:MAG TPA: DUF3455 domain-containing protein [Alphaproteobacteria bacterium]|jgi:hypothetical protein|nr:DUF3455 domain-containing protein [Alphaproteobacteria bacterium]